MLAARDYWYNRHAIWFQPWCAYIQDLQEWDKPTQIPTWAQVGILREQFKKLNFLTTMADNLGEVLQVDMSSLYIVHLLYVGTMSSTYSEGLYDPSASASHYPKYMVKEKCRISCVSCAYPINATDACLPYK